MNLSASGSGTNTTSELHILLYSGYNFTLNPDAEDYTCIVRVGTKHETMKGKKQGVDVIFNQSAFITLAEKAEDVQLRVTAQFPSGQVIIGDGSVKIPATGSETLPCPLYFSEEHKGDLLLVLTVKALATPVVVAPLSRSSTPLRASMAAPPPGAYSGPSSNPPAPSPSPTPSPIPSPHVPSQTPAPTPHAPAQKPTLPQNPSLPHNPHPHAPAQTPTAPPPQPFQLRQFLPQEIIREPPPFAKGSYGLIYKGKVAGIPKTVVIKDMDIRDAKSIEDWRKEVSTMAHNRSPYTVEIYGYSSAGNTLVIVMEYMSLGDLYGILHKKRHPLSKLQRMRMARHVAYGVAFLHSHHVMHRDIKSMNVLVTEDYACKLTDFGTAKIVQSNALFNTINAGTPMWMAPEVKMSNNYSFSADVYSLGLVLFELFENRLPEWNAARQCIMMPPTYESMSFVSPCINPQPRARPTADEVCKVLDKMIRNVVVGVKKNLPDNDQFKASGDSEDEIQALYRDLVKRPPQEVDGLILKSFPQSTSLPSAPNNQIPTGMPMGVPPMGMAQGFPMGPQGVPLGVSQGFPQGMPMGMPGVPMGMPPQQPYGYPQIPTTFPPGYPPGY